MIAADNGRREQALEIFARARALAPDNPDYAAEAGKTLIALRRHREALAAAGQGLALGPERATTWNTLGSEVLNSATLRAGLALDPATLGRQYLESTRPRTGQRAHFIDKLPLNFAYLGLIRRALPGARFICLRRDPMDTCVSNYRQQFASNFPYYRYALDLLDCGRYYLAFDRLIRHWQAVLPGGLLEVQYEQLVTEPEAQAQRLLDWCELPWEPGCLDFQQRREAVATASAVQVRRGIYRDSLQLWRRYASEVEPLRALLQRAGVV